MNQLPDVRPGWKTSEFWIKLVTQLTLLAVLLFKLDPATANTLQEAVVQIVEAIFVVIASAAVLISYINSRTNIKTAAIQANSASKELPIAKECSNQNCPEGGCCARQS